MADDIDKMIDGMADFDILKEYAITTIPLLINKLHQQNTNKWQMVDKNGKHYRRSEYLYHSKCNVPRY